MINKKFYIKGCIIISMILLASIANASATTVTVESANIGTGGIRNITINITNVTNLNAAGLNLTFNSSVIKVNDIKAGSFWNPSVFPNIQNQSGFASAIMDLPGVSTVSGNGTLAIVTVQAIGNMGSSSSLNLQAQAGALLADDLGNPIPAIIQNGMINIPYKGDVDDYPGITMADAMYIGKAALGKSGFPLDTTTMDVDGCPDVTINDALYLAKYVIGVPGFADLPASVCKSAG